MGVLKILVGLLVGVTSFSTMVHAEVRVSSPTIQCRAVDMGPESKVLFDAPMTDEVALLAIAANGEVFTVPSPHLGFNLMSQEGRDRSERADEPGAYLILIQAVRGQIQLDVYQHDEMATKAYGSASLRANNVELTCRL